MKDATNILLQVSANKLDSATAMSVFDEILPIIQSEKDNDVTDHRALWFLLEEDSEKRHYWLKAVMNCAESCGITVEADEPLLDFLCKLTPTDEEKLLKIGSIRLHIQTCDDGWDYDVYDENWILLDGGQIDNPDLSVDEIITEILEDYPSVDPSTAEELPLQMLDDIHDAEEARIEEILNSMPKSEA